MHTEHTYIKLHIRLQVNSLREEDIQQSNSFKRLMFHVLGDTEF